MNGHHLETVCAHSLERRVDLAFEHGDVARDGCVFTCAYKSRPGVEAHAGIDRCSHLFHREVITANGDFVHRASLLALVAHNFRDSLGVQRTLFGGAALD